MAVILVIDDDDLVRGTIRAILTTAGHTVALAANGRVGVDRLKTEPFDAVITDILMPEQEGLETIREIRKVDRRIGILVMSGSSRTANVDFFSAALAFGADTALSKPFTPRELLDSVRDVLAKRQSRIG